MKCLQLKGICHSTSESSNVGLERKAWIGSWKKLLLPVVYFIYYIYLITVSINIIYREELPE